jgi:hypothetical protein
MDMIPRFMNDWNWRHSSSSGYLWEEARGSALLCQRLIFSLRRGQKAKGNRDTLASL